MGKRQIKVIVIFLELFLIAALFLPAGRIINDSKSNDTNLSVFGMIARYGGMGFGTDALFYTILACALPVAIILTVLLFRERYNFGTSTILCALQTVSSACFFSAASQKLVDYSAMTMLPYLMGFAPLAAMMLLIYAFLLSEPGARRNSKKEDGTGEGEENT